MHKLLKNPFKINNIAGMQAFQIIRFTTFLIISIILTKSPLTIGEIGEFEALLFMASVASYFWMTGLIQSFLPLYNNNAAFPGEKIDVNHKSPEIFNAFLLISFFSLLIFTLGHSFKNNIYLFKDMRNIPHINLLLLYILLSNPAHFVEYIYLLRNKSNAILNYGVITYVIQLIIVAGPVLMGMGLKPAVIGLIIVSVIRLIWLGFLLAKYAEFKFSPSFMKSHLKLGGPLIVGTLLSGSAQYIDGLVVLSKFNREAFALFRYGAKELPVVILLAQGLHNAMIPEISKPGNLAFSLSELKKKTLRLNHIIFPVSIVFLFFSDFIFPRLFNENFMRSSDIFMVYILLAISRILLPNTILIGLKRTRIIMLASMVEVVLNVGLSLYLIQFYGLVGVAVATVIIYFVEKIILVAYTYYALGIKPSAYIPVVSYLIYSVLLISTFVLIDHDVIQVF